MSEREKANDFGEGCHLQLIDGSGYIFRAFYMSQKSLPSKNRYRRDKTPIGAIHFFSNMLLSLLRRRQSKDTPTHAAVVFDYSGHTFRNNIFSEYKANRPPPPEELVPQFPLSRDAVRAFNFACLELEGFEADDIIATLATEAKNKGGRVTIVSSDKDLMQLVNEGISMFDPMKDMHIGREQVLEKFAVKPERVIDVQALAGDSTDNIPGAPGIGIKTASMLINEFGDLDSLLERAEEIQQTKRRQTLIEHADQIRMSRELVTLKRNVPTESIMNNLNDLEIKEPDPQTLLNFLQKQEFRTILSRVASYLNVKPPQPDPFTKSSKSPLEAKYNLENYECVSDIKQLDSWINKVQEAGFVAFDTETNGVDEMQASLVGVSLAVDPGEACYIPLRHATEPKLLEEAVKKPIVQIDINEALVRLKSILEDDSILKIGHNIKFDVKIMHQEGIRVAPVDDTMLMSYALHAGLHNHSMNSLSTRYLNHNPMQIKELLGSGKKKITFDQVSIDDAVKYSGEDADVTLRLWHWLRPRLHKSQATKVYETLERPMIEVLADMEESGIKVDKSQLERLSMRFHQKLKELEKEIFKQADTEFNINSPKQLGNILFDKLNLPGGKRLANGGYATSAQILDTLAIDGHKLPELILEYRKIAKLKSTYTDSLLDRIHPKTRRVHTSYVISGANTGRLASTEPNLQNIPVRTEDGRLIREAFIAKEDSLLLSLDYSQIELRVLAHMADIKALKKAFREGHDIHAMTASQIFEMPIEGMDPMVRRRAKAINFGVIYGISAFGLARDLQISRSEAQEFINRYFERFPGIRSYMDRTIAFARTNNFVSTMFGRKIHTPFINEKPPRRQAAERGAINAPIQGSAADIIRRAMVRIPAVLEGMPAKMLVQVHDELLFEVRKDAIEDVIASVSEVMVNADRPAAQITPSLVVDAGYAKNWSKAH